MIDLANSARAVLFSAGEGVGMEGIGGAVSFWSGVMMWGLCVMARGESGGWILEVTRFVTEARGL